MLESRNLYLGCMWEWGASNDIRFGSIVRDIVDFILQSEFGNWRHCLKYKNENECQNLMFSEKSFTQLSRLSDCPLL